MSTLRVNNVTNAGGTGPTYAPGHAIQTVQFNYKAKQAFTVNDYTASGVTATITPKSATSKILVTVVVHLGVHGGSEGVHGRLYRNGVNIDDTLGDAASTRDRVWFHCGALYAVNEIQAVTAVYLDSPATVAATTYTVYVRGYSSSYPFNINASEADSDNFYNSRPVSSITLTEIAQ